MNTANTAICPCPIKDTEEPLTPIYPVLNMGQVFDMCGCLYRVVKPITRVFTDIRGLWQSPLNKVNLTNAEQMVYSAFRRGESFILPTEGRFLSLLLFFGNYTSLFLNTTFKDVFEEVVDVDSEDDFSVDFKIYYNLRKEFLKIFTVNMPHLMESPWVKEAKGGTWKKTHKYQSYIIEAVEWIARKQQYVVISHQVEWTQKHSVFTHD